MIDKAFNNYKNGKTHIERLLEEKKEVKVFFGYDNLIDIIDENGFVVVGEEFEEFENQVIRLEYEKIINFKTMQTVKDSKPFYVVKENGKFILK